MPYSPTFEGPIQGYLANFAAKHQWRVSRLYAHDDLIQEGYLIFSRCASKYPDVTEAPHFMSLFKMAWHNHFTDLANEDTLSRVLVQHSEFESEDGGYVAIETAGDLDQDGYLSALLRQAPREISMVLNLFLNAPQEMLDIALGPWRPGGGRAGAGGSNKRICQMLGLDPSRDVLKAVEEYFQPQ